MGFMADLFGLHRPCTVNDLPFDVKYYIQLAGSRWWQFLCENVDLIIMDRGLKKCLGQALLTNNYPPKKIKLTDDPDYIHKYCFGRRDLLALNLASVALHEAAHWNQFIKAQKVDESFPQYTEARFMEVLSSKLRNKPFEIVVPSLDGQRPWSIQYYGNLSKRSKTCK